MDEMSMTNMNEKGKVVQLTSGTARTKEPRCSRNAEANERNSSYYPANIAAACHKTCVAQVQPKSTIVDDPLKLEKRRKCNRLSAQRWRVRKRSKLSDLQDQIQFLQKEHVKLDIEKSKLQAELRYQLALTQAHSTHLPSSFANSRLEASQLALSFSQKIRMEQNPDMTTKAPQSTRDAYSDTFCLNEHVFLRGNNSIPAWSPPFVSTLTSNALTGNGFCNTQLRTILQAAASPVSHSGSRKQPR